MIFGKLLSGARMASDAGKGNRFWNRWMWFAQCLLGLYVILGPPLHILSPAIGLQRRLALEVGCAGVDASQLGLLLLGCLYFYRMRRSTTFHLVDVVVLGLHMANLYWMGSAILCCLLTQ